MHLFFIFFYFTLLFLSFCLAILSSSDLHVNQVVTKVPLKNLKMKENEI